MSFHAVSVMISFHHSFMAYLCIHAMPCQAMLHRLRLRLLAKATAGREHVHRCGMVKF